MTEIEGLVETNYNKKSFVGFPLIIATKKQRQQHHHQQQGRFCCYF